MSIIYYSSLLQLDYYYLLLFNVIKRGNTAPPVMWLCNCSNKPCAKFTVTGAVSTLAGRCKRAKRRELAVRDSAIYSVTVHQQPAAAAENILSFLLMRRHHPTLWTWNKPCKDSRNKMALTCSSLLIKYLLFFFNLLFVVSICVAVCSFFLCVQLFSFLPAIYNNNDKCTVKADRQ